MCFQHYVVAALLAIPSVAHGQADSVVIRITSPRGTEVQFSGVITLKDNKTQRRFDRVSTPFEVKLPAQSVDARFTATDGGALSADLVTYREGKQRGQVTGTMYSGEVKLYLEPGVAFGFGPRAARPLSP
jgi:hypothetical protein